jgi:hypothetical protein
MRRISLLVVLAVSILIIAMTVAAETLPRGAQLLGIANSKGVEPSFDKQLQGELDRLLPQLKQLNSDAAILIEAFYPQAKGKNRSQQISSAFSLAEQVQQFLKTTRSLNREFFIAIWENPEEISSYPKIRITTYPRDYFEN